MFQSPVIKFIGKKEMVIPITRNGYLLSHQAYINHYYPTPIEIIDAEGMYFTYQRAELIPGIQWLDSFRYVSPLYRIKPILTAEPTRVDLNMLKDRVYQFIKQAPRTKGIDMEEREDLLVRIRACLTHQEVIGVVNSVSYWR